MATQTSDTNYKLQEPYNPLDPIVVFDPENVNSGIVLQWDPGEGEEGADPTKESNKESKVKQDAIRVPLIKLNNKVIDKTKIKSFKMSVKGFLPTVELEIRDFDGNIQASDVPGINNIITHEKTELRLSNFTVKSSEKLFRLIRNI